MTANPNALLQSFTSKLANDLHDILNESASKPYITEQSDRDGASFFRTAGFRIFFKTRDNTDPSYHLNEAHTKTIEKNIQYYNENHLDWCDLNAKYTSIQDFFNNACESDLDNYYEGLDEWVSEQAGGLVLDISYYAKDNHFNKSGQDIVLITSHLSDSNVYFISPTGNDYYENIFTLEQIEHIERNERTDRLACYIEKSLKQKPFARRLAIIKTKSKLNVY
jgi:hypothetical protein